MSKSFCWTCLPQASPLSLQVSPCGCTSQNTVDIDPTWWSWGHGSAPGASSSAQGWRLGWRLGQAPGWCAPSVCPWPGHLPGTHLQLPWLENHSFPPAPKGLKLWNGKVQGSNAAIWARSTQPAASERKIQAVLFKTLSCAQAAGWVSVPHNAPVEGDIICSLPTLLFLAA